MKATIQERTLLLYNRADSQHTGIKVSEKIPPFQLYKKIGRKFPDTWQGICETLQCLLMEKFIEEVNAEEHNPESLINLVQNSSRKKTGFSN